MSAKERASKHAFDLMPALGRLDPLAQRAVVIAAAAGLVAAAWLLVCGPLYRADRRSLARLSELKARIGEAHQMTSHAAANQDAFNAAQSAYQSVYRRVAGDQTLPRVLEALGHQAKQHRLKLVAIQPDEDDAPGLFAVDDRLTVRAVPIRLHLMGRYQQLGQFLGAVSTASYLAAVEQVTVTRPGLDSPQLEAEITVSVYVADGPQT